MAHQGCNPTTSSSVRAAVNRLCSRLCGSVCGRLMVVCASEGRVKTTRHFVCASTLLHMWHPTHHRQGFSVADGRRDDRATLLREMDARETEARPRCCLFDSRRRFADPGSCGWTMWCAHALFTACCCCDHRTKSLSRSRTVSSLPARSSPARRPALASTRRSASASRPQRRPLRASTSTRSARSPATSRSAAVFSRASCSRPR